MKKILSYKEFIVERYDSSKEESSLILEGGAAGHMAHPFDDNSLTFADFKRIVTSALQGKLDFEQAPTEKTDGQNLFASVKDGKTIFSRNKGQLIAPIGLKGIIEMFTDHASALVEETYIKAAKDLDSALTSLKDQSMFNDGKSFVNMEIIFTKNPNVINYDRGNLIQFHNIVHTDGQGNIIGEEQKLGTELAKALQKIKKDVQQTYTIIPPQILRIAKDVNFDDRVNYYYKKIDALRDAYKLADTDEVKMYHEKWWRSQIESEFSDIPTDAQEGMLLRWAYGDKKTLDLRAVAKLVDKDQLKRIKEFDKISGKKYKENILPFENLFLELGADVLKNVSNFVAASPDAEKQRLHKQIRTESEKIKKNGDLSQINKVEKELKRLESIGGIESIVPSEGVVFKYNGKLFKLTGTFAAINQLMGIIKYVR